MTAEFRFLHSDSPEKLKFTNGTSPLAQKLLATLAEAPILRLLTPIRRIGPRASKTPNVSSELKNIKILMRKLFR